MGFIHPGTIYTFKLGGDAEFPEKLPAFEHPLTTIRDNASPDQIGNGFTVFSRFCISCHPMPGAGHASIPDLARSTDAILENYNQILFEGTFASEGMPSFEGMITEDEIQDLKSFIYYSAQAVEDKMAPNDYLTSIAQMQYLADQKLLLKD